MSGEKTQENVPFVCCAGRGELALWFAERGVITVHGNVLPCASKAEAARIVAAHRAG